MDVVEVVENTCTWILWYLGTTCKPFWNMNKTHLHHLPRLSTRNLSCCLVRSPDQEFLCIPWSIVFFEDKIQRILLPISRLPTGVNDFCMLMWPDIGLNTTREIHEYLFWYWDMNENAYQRVVSWFAAVRELADRATFHEREYLRWHRRVRLCTLGVSWC